MGQPIKISSGAAGGGNPRPRDGKAGRFASRPERDVPWEGRGAGTGNPRKVRKTIYAQK